MVATKHKDFELPVNLLICVLYSRDAFIGFV